MSLSRCDPVNPLTPTFGNINLTETMRNLIVPWKVDRVSCTNLYLHPKPFKTALKRLGEMAKKLNQK